MTKKRIICFLSAIMLIISLFPVAILAEGNDEMLNIYDETPETSSVAEGLSDGDPDICELTDEPEVSGVVSETSSNFSYIEESEVLICSSSLDAEQSLEAEESSNDEKEEKTEVSSVSSIPEKYISSGMDKSSVSSEVEEENTVFMEVSAGESSFVEEVSGNGEGELYFESDMPVYKSEGDVRYVDEVNGDDTNDGLSEETAFKSLVHAVGSAPSGGSVVLLSNVSVKHLISIWKPLTIMSKEGKGPYTIRRSSGFATSSDPARGTYHPAMFEFHSDSGDMTLTFKDVVLDDNGLTEGTSFSDQSRSGSGNTNKVHDAIIAVYTTQNNATVVLDNAVLKDFGGYTAVYIQGSKGILHMKNGSAITDTRTSSKGFAAIRSAGQIIMEQGSKIDGIKGATALHSRSGTVKIDGEVTNCTSPSDGAVINLNYTTAEVGPTGKIHHNKSQYGAIYVMASSVLTVKGDLSYNENIARNCRASAIYATDNLGSPTVIIEKDAYIHHNKGYIYNYSVGGLFTFPIDIPFIAAVLANTNTTLIMNGGKISENTCPFGVFVRKNSRFEMNDGEITKNNRGIGIGDEDTTTARVKLKGGTVSNNTTDIVIQSLSKAGLTNGSYYYADEEMISGGVTFSLTPKHLSTNESNLITYILASDEYKHITPDASMKELYIAHASTAGATYLNNVQEIKDGVLLATWFAKNKDDIFDLTIKGLSYRNSNVYVCIVPVDGTGAATGDHKIFVCDKTKDGNSMFVDAYLSGTGSETGYAFALFADPELDEETYTLHYETYGGGDIPSLTGLSILTSNLLPATEPSKDTWRFDGWYMEETFENKVTAGTTYADIVGNDVSVTEATIYAKYVSTLHKVKYEYEGNYPKAAEALLPAEATVNAGTGVTVAQNPELAGYTFSGWDKSDFIMPDENVIIKGSWTANNDTPYSVETYYEKDGKYPAKPDEVNKLTGTTDTKTSVPEELRAASRENYIFDVSADNILKGVIAADGSLVLKIYFREQFSVSYEPGEFGTWDIEIHDDLRYGDNTPEFGGDPKKDHMPGYSFKGWSPALSETVSRTVIYVAQWTADETNYRVEYYFEKDGKYPSSADDYVERSGAADTVVSVTDADRIPSKTGYVFDENAPNILKGTVHSDDSLILRVYFKAEFRLTFDLAGGTIKGSDEAVEIVCHYGDEVEIIEAPLREGYVFLYWKGSEYQPGDIFKATEDHTFTAQWERDTDPVICVITYTDGVEGETVFEDLIFMIEIGSDTPSFIGTPIREGYKFDGWSPAVSEKVTEDATYTAKWVKNGETPVTGEGSRLLLLCLVMMISLAGLVSLIYFSQKMYLPFR